MVTQASPFPFTIAFLAYLWYAYYIIIYNAIAYGMSAVKIYYGSCP